MKPEAQQIAIAEFCGWTKRRKLDCEPDEWVWNNSDGQLRGQGCIPNYVRDLNAMHEAESKLEHPEAFASRLGPILLRDGSASNQDGTTAWHFAFAHATAAQRAEALLRTIGKWTE